jgi:hypothetical protein
MAKEKAAEREQNKRRSIQEQMKVGKISLNIAILALLE